jgi:RHS repeat-associated protein
MNAISIAAPSCEGLSFSEALGGTFAQVTVTYAPAGVVICPGPSDPCHEAGVCDPSSGACSSPIKIDGSVCDDGNACTQGDTCQGGECMGGAAVSCSAIDACHTAGVCDPATGSCSDPAAANGTACSDGNPCTQGEACQGGACVGGAAIPCSASDACHVAGVCDPATGACTNPAAPDGTACSDENPCTQSDICQGGECTGGAAVTCSASDACHVAGVCDPVTGSCTNPPAVNGTTCSDGNACTGGDACQAGICTGGVAVNCSAADACHVTGVCDPVTGACSDPAAANGTACDDGNACTLGDACQGGECVGGAAVACPALDACHLGACDPVTGACTNLAAPNGTACDDGNACTQGDTCQGGACASGETCPASDACHLAGICDPATSACTNPAAAIGTPCEDGNPCNGIGACDGAGQCVAGSPLNLDDGDPCTFDTCDPVQGVVHAPCSTVDPTVATSVFDSTAFLYSGPDAPQTGVAPGTIVVTRAAVIRGRILTMGDAPIAGASASVIHHPEFGSTTTSADGVFNLAVNGGGPLTVNIAAPGLLPAQRTVDVPWSDYAATGDIVLVPFDPIANPIDLAAPDPFQIAQGSVSTDADGSRRATLLFAAGTAATMTLPGGLTAPLEGDIHVRATEFTVGPNGDKAMPGTLPKTSAYTYAAELSIDEAVAAGATRVDFSQPVIVYVDDFLGFPAGLDVPAGFYDRSNAAWKAAPSGRTLAVLSIAGGIAQLDTDGDGMADTANELDALGITADEQAEIALFASAGDTLWRVPVQHFTAWDLNWGFGPPPDGCAPFDPACAAGGPGGSAGGSGSGGPGPDPRGDDPKDDPCVQRGSIIECENQILGERVPVAGTPFHLDYRSDRVPGRAAVRALDVPVSGDTLPPGLKRIDLTVDIAGRTLTDSVTCPCAPNQTYTFAWDGKDAFARSVRGAQPVTVTIGYVYDGVYEKTERFGYTGNGASISGSKTRREVSLLKVWKGKISPRDQKWTGLGGFSLSSHHAYDPLGKTLYLGDGRRRHAEASEPVISTVAGGNGGGFSGDGGPAKAAQLAGVRGIAVAPDGSIYIADTVGCVVRKVAPNGVITTVAGDPSFCEFSGDGGPATTAHVTPLDVKLGPNGSLYIADNNLHVLEIDPSGILRTIAGSGAAGSSGDGGPAISATLDVPRRLAIAPDGTIYVATQALSGTTPTAGRVRRIGTDGIINTVAGGGASDAEGVAATSAEISWLQEMALGPDGSLYLGYRASFFSAPRIRRVTIDGIITTIAGVPSAWWLGYVEPDTQEATLSPLGDIGGLALGSDGSVYFGESDQLMSVQNGKRRIRKVSPDGILSVIAGGLASPFAGEAGPAPAATMLGFDGLATAPNGALYAAINGYRIVQVSDSMPGLSVEGPRILSEDGTELYVFNRQGRHLQTIDVHTGAVRYAFAYDPAGKLESVTDIDGLLTTIQYDAQGHPSAIIAPHGQVTALAVDGNGYLASVTDPSGSATHFTFGSTGLLASMTDAKGQTHSFGYDGVGRLVHDQDPAGGFKDLARTSDAAGAHVTVTTALGRVSTYASGALLTGDETRSSLLPDGTQASSTRSANGTRTATRADGTTVTIKRGPDPRFGMQVPIVVSEIVKTPGNLTRTVLRARTAPLADPTDLLSFTTVTDTTTVNGHSTQSVFDKALGTITTTSPLGRQSTTVLDAKGRVIEVQVPGLLPVEHVYDASGHLMSTTRGTRTWTRAYDGAGELASVTDPLLQATSFLRDPVGRVTSVTRPDGQSIGTSYDANGNATTVTPPGQSAHQLGFTPVDLLASYSPPDLGIGPVATGYTYDLDHLLSQVTRPDQGTLVYQRDAAGRLSLLTLPSGQGALSYTYHPTTGKLASVAGPAGVTLSYTRDGSLLTERAWSGLFSASVHRSYDDDFRVASESVNGGGVVSFGYDEDGLLVQAGALSLSRDPQNGLLTGSALGVVSDALTYNGHGEVVHYEAQAGAASLYTVTYTRDALGRIASLSETVLGEAHTYDYSYDLAGRLTDVLRDGASVGHYDYDANGNRLSRSSPAGTVSGSYDAQDRLLTYGTKVYGYTANGELSSVQEAGGGGLTSYAYDALGNLRHVVLPSGAVVEYVIDGENHRVWKNKSGVAVQGFMWAAGLRLVAELGPDGSVVSRFVYGRGRNVPEVVRKGGVDYRIVTDHLGSPRLVVNSATGAVAQRMEYDELGRVLVDTSPGFQPFGFAGGVYDAETGLVRFGARDYDADTGRWTAKDPIRFLGGDANLYSYVGVDPVNSADPGGLAVELCAGQPQTWPLSSLPFAHYWLRTDTKEAGMGGDSCPDTCIESNVYADKLYPDHHCQVVENIDEACVDDALSIGAPLGPWVPFFYDCRTFALGVLNQCYRAPPVENSVCDVEPSACR